MFSKVIIYIKFIKEKLNNTLLERYTYIVKQCRITKE